MKKFFTLTLVFCLLSFNSITIHANDTEPRIQVYPCSGSYNVVTKTGSDYDKIINHTGIIVVPTVTYSVAQSFATTVSNQTNINLVPEFLSWGYSASFTAGTNLLWSKTNNTSRNLELVLKTFYDTFSVNMFIYQSEGSCTLTTRNMDMYKGWGYDLV